MRNIERRLKALEAHFAQAQSDQGVMTLHQWRDLTAAAQLPEQLPNASAAQAWWQTAQARRQQCAEIMAIFEE